MKWSSTSIFMSCPARMKSRVILMSASDGVGSPEGWLCIRITAAALAITATRNVSRGCTRSVSIVPMVTSWWPLTRLRVFRSKTTKHSHSGLKYGFVATFFVIADRIGQPSFLAANEIQILVAAGNDIGDHTVNHNALTAAQPKALTYEIDSAAATIAAITGRWPETLAYPLGETDSRVMAAVAACKPLRLAVVEGSGGQETWATRFRVSRIQVGSQRLPADLLAQVQRVGR